jgi:hypothetical protein
MGDPRQYNKTAALNNGVPPVGAPEGMAPSAVNDVLRELMASLATLTEGVRNGSLVGVDGKLPADRFESPLPAGTIIMSGKHDVFPGFLECGGQEVLRSAYPALFAAIGTAYNWPTTPATHFGLPDFRSTFPLGQDWHGNPLPSKRVTLVNTDLMGARGGNQMMQAHTHVASIGPAGNHSHTGVTDIVGDHVHTINIQPEGLHSHAIQQGGSYNANNVVSTNVSGTNQTAPATNSAVIKSSGLHVHSANMEATGRHGHNIGTYPVPDHTHSISINVSGAGGSENLPPFVTVKFFIKT